MPTRPTRHRMPLLVERPALGAVLSLALACSTSHEPAPPVPPPDSGPLEDVGAPPPRDVGTPPPRDVGTPPPTDVGPAVCTSDRECDDGDFCDGPERCDPRALGADRRGCVAGAPPCPRDCDPVRAACTDACDGDADGHRALECGGDDCDDTRPELGAPTFEACDGLDNDCDAFIDEFICPCVDTGPRLCDMPGICAAGVEECRDGVWSSCSIGPVEERCDGYDDDCDGSVDEGACE